MKKHVMLPIALLMIIFLASCGAPDKDKEAQSTSSEPVQSETSANMKAKSLRRANRLVI